MAMTCYQNKIYYYRDGKRILYGATRVWCHAYALAQHISWESEGKTMCDGRHRVYFKKGKLWEK